MMNKANLLAWSGAITTPLLLLGARISRLHLLPRWRKSDLRPSYITPRYASGQRLEFLLQHFEQREANRQEIARKGPLPPQRR